MPNNNAVSCMVARTFALCLSYTLIAGTVCGGGEQVLASSPLMLGERPATQEDNPATLKIILAELKIKIKLLDRDDHYVHSRHLLAEASEQFKSSPALNLDLLDFWSQVDRDALLKIEDTIGPARTSKWKDHQMLEAQLQKEFDSEFYKQWYGYGILRGVGYSTAEYLWKAEWINRECDDVAEFCVDRQLSSAQAIQERYEALQKSLEDWSKASKLLFLSRLTEAQSKEGIGLLNSNKVFKSNFDTSRRNWISYNIVSPRLASASFLVWQADYCFKEDYQKRGNIEKALATLERLDLRTVRECAPEIMVQYKTVVGEVDALCKKHPKIRETSQIVLENLLAIAEVLARVMSRR